MNKSVDNKLVQDLNNMKGTAKLTATNSKPIFSPEQVTEHGLNNRTAISISFPPKNLCKIHYIIHTSFTISKI